MQLVIILKILWLSESFLINSYFTAINVEWYYYPIIFGYYLFTLGPIMLHTLYFMATIQKKIKDMVWFQELDVNVKCILISGVFFSIPCIIGITVFLSKGIIFYYVISSFMIYQFMHATIKKRYVFTRVIIYDYLLTFLMTAMGYFLPALNFSPLTPKDIVIFWNYYIGVFIFGVMFSKIFIKMEMAEEQYVE